MWKGLPNLLQPGPGDPRAEEINPSYSLFFSLSIGQIHPEARKNGGH